MSERKAVTKQKMTHRFGETLALANSADPWSSNGVDVNVATLFNDAESVLKALKLEGFSVESDPALALLAAGTRWVRGFDVATSS